MKDLRVNISPGVSMLAVLSRLNYKPWYALAEYVDNSVQSMLSRRDELLDADGEDFKLKIRIDINPNDGGEIVIRDNAAGISIADFPRAFRAAQIPPDRSGLSEFGMGMKSASCWFAKNWSVRTTALGSEDGHTVQFDISSIVDDEINELEVVEFSAAADTHFTEVRLWNLNHTPVRRTLGKVKQHLRDIYRVFIRRGWLEIQINGEALVYEEPKILVAPYFREQDTPSLEWRKDISFDLGDGLTVTGFAALREKGDTQNSGFSLFRRNRVIEGSGDDGYRPATVFGGGNSFRSQRLFGELHLSGFDVSHTKDGFQWDSNEETFLDLLRDALDSEPLPLLKQAEGYRSKAPPLDLEKTTTTALSNTVDTLKENLPIALTSLGDMQPVEPPTRIDSAPESVFRNLAFQHADQDWDFRIEVSRDEGEPRWMWHSTDTSEVGRQKVHIRINATHPFMIRFGSNGVESLEVVLRLAVAMVVGEILARASGVKLAGTVTRNIDKIVSAALSNP
jgi:hypothetical protein